MTEEITPFSHLSLEQAIALRWTLRDIKAKRMLLLPVKDADMQILLELKLIEIKDGQPQLTPQGHSVLD
jgi:hypothetical protein